MVSDTVDQYWDDYFGLGGDFISINSQELKRLLEYIPARAPKTALDIGCGTGQLTRDLYHSGYKTVGVDVAEKALDIARSLSARDQGKLRYAKRDVDKEGLAGLPFAPYGLITCQSVYAFIKNKESLLSNVNKVLAPNGVFVIISMLKKNVPPHKREAALDQDATQKELKNHFKVTYYEKSGLGYFVCQNKWQSISKAARRSYKGEALSEKSVAGIVRQARRTSSTKRDR